MVYLSDEGIGVFQCPVCYAAYQGKITDGTSYSCGGSPVRPHKPAMVMRVAGSGTTVKQPAKSDLAI